MLLTSISGQKGKCRALTLSTSRSSGSKYPALRGDHHLYSGFGCGLFLLCIFLFVYIL